MALSLIGKRVLVTGNQFAKSVHRLPVGDAVEIAQSFVKLLPPEGLFVFRSALEEVLTGSGCCATSWASPEPDSVRLTLQLRDRAGSRYWYAYVKVKGKTQQFYVGKELSEARLLQIADFVKEVRRGQE